MRRLPPLIHALLALAGLVAAAFFLVGRTFTDRFLVTQYLYWTPSLAFLAITLGLSLGALIFGAVRISAIPKRHRPARFRSVRLTRAALTASLLIALHIAFIEWRSWRYIFPAPPASSDHSLIVLHWNMTYVEPGQWQAFLDAMPIDPKPDIIVLTNPIWSSEIGELADRLGEEYRVVRVGTFGVATRFGISVSASARLGIPTADSPALLATPRDPDITTGELLPSWSPIPRVGGSSRDPGHIMAVELDTTDVLGRSLVVWGIDLPSDITQSRYASARTASQTIDAMMAATPSLTTTASPTPSKPLSAPDLIVGDFNTPRGSASLSLLNRGFPHAFSQAGHGYAATWPRQRRGPLGQRVPNAAPIFHLDHTFVAPWLRASKYELIDPGIAEHYVHRVTVTPG